MGLRLLQVWIFAYCAEQTQHLRWGYHTNLVGFMSLHISVCTSPCNQLTLFFPAHSPTCFPAPRYLPSTPLYYCQSLPPPLQKIKEGEAPCKFEWKQSSHCLDTHVQESNHWLLQQNLHLDKWKHKRERQAVEAQGMPWRFFFFLCVQRLCVPWFTFHQEKCGTCLPQ